MTINVSPRSYQMMYKRQAYYDEQEMREIRLHMNSVQQTYYLSQIRMLEQRQLIDSVAFVHGQQGEQYTISFEKNTHAAHYLIDSHTLLRLNRHREHSLFTNQSLS